MPASADPILGLASGLEPFNASNAMPPPTFDSRLPSFRQPSSTFEYASVIGSGRSRLSYRPPYSTSTLRPRPSPQNLASPEKQNNRFLEDQPFFSSAAEGSWTELAGCWGLGCESCVVLTSVSGLLWTIMYLPRYRSRNQQSCRRAICLSCFFMSSLSIIVGKPQ